MTDVTFLRRPGYSRDTMALILEACAEQGLEANDTHRNRRQIELDDRAPILFRWGCTSRYPDGENVTLNHISDIKKASDKASFRKLLVNSEITATPRLFTQRSLTSGIPDGDGFVIRPNQHTGGSDFHFFRTAREAYQFSRNAPWPHYIQRFIPKDREVRIFFFDGRIIAVADKIVEDTTQLVWNHSEGSSFQNVRWRDWPLRACWTVLQANRHACPLDFGAADVIIDREGNPYILEFNTAPMLDSPYRASLIAKVLKHRKDNNNVIPNNPRRRTSDWKDYIHPAVQGDKK